MDSVYFCVNFSCNIKDKSPYPYFAHTWGRLHLDTLIWNSFWECFSRTISKEIKSTANEIKSKSSHSITLWQQHFLEIPVPFFLIGDREVTTWVRLFCNVLGEHTASFPNNGSYFPNPSRVIPGRQEWCNMLCAIIDMCITQFYNLWILVSGELLFLRKQAYCRNSRKFTKEMNVESIRPWALSH